MANDVCVDVNIKILEALRENVGGQKDSVKFIKQNNPKCCRPNCCNYLRSSILYTLYPYDRSLWSRLRDPWYFLFKLFTIFPLYYVSIATWFILWLMKDKRDEYTLVKFIVDLKSSLFVSAVLSSILGNIIFLRCTTIDPTTLPCHSNSPGQLQPFWPGKYSSEGAAREWSTVVDISIPPLSFKHILLSLSRISSFLKHPNKSFFNPINIFDTFTHSITVL